jgi:hypothetical protein
VGLKILTQVTSVLNEPIPAPATRQTSTATGEQATPNADHSVTTQCNRAKRSEGSKYVIGKGSRAAAIAAAGPERELLLYRLIENRHSAASRLFDVTLVQLRRSAVYQE